MFTSVSWSSSDSHDPLLLYRKWNYSHRARFGAKIKTFRPRLRVGRHFVHKISRKPLSNLGSRSYTRKILVFKAFLTLLQLWWVNIPMYFWGNKHKLESLRKVKRLKVKDFKARIHAGLHVKCYPMLFCSRRNEAWVWKRKEHDS